MNPALHRWIFASAVCLAGCSTPSIYGPNDLGNDAPSGGIKPLQSLVTRHDGKIRLVMIHGVGDHCIGYGFDGDDAWLRPRTLRTVGLSAVDGPRRIGKISASVFSSADEDARSYVAYQVRPFTLAIDDRQVPVEAIEITWSHLTQWIKSNQLGYDSPSVTPKPGAHDGPCVDAPDASVPDSKSPPDRLIVDRVIKEQVFDRSLADAILYSGAYGAVMEVGVAEALCHAITGQSDRQRCVWPDPSADDGVVNLFVTHSLGSRLIYDVMLDLTNVERVGHTNPFEPNDATEAFVSRLLADTPAFYMMANQLALLGLANVPPSHGPKDSARPFRYVFPHGIPGLDAPVVPGADAVASSTCIDGAIPRWDVLRLLARSRQESARAFRLTVPQLQLVAFNDTNDLLTWHIPNWYDQKGDRCDDRTNALVNVVNVFVTTTTPLLIIENPVAAHDDYFRNASVWQAIRCGGTRGRIDQCAR